MVVGAISVSARDEIQDTTAAGSDWPTLGMAAWQNSFFFWSEQKHLLRDNIAQGVVGVHWKVINIKI